ncbi:MAG: hypothetical protein M3O93_04245 [Chloroflexota bacterium]|nr:hypothetical protein [Chloroflexota bacterium]
MNFTGIVEPRLRLSLGTLGHTTPDGMSDIYVHPETAVVKVRALTPTVVGG